jgi:dTDP-4-dehydrorhamnose reductase
MGVKILVTGRDGQVGHELMRTLAPLGKVIGVDIKECDLTKSAMVEALLERVKPDVIVNPAAYTAVDKAESEPTVAHAVNAQAPKILARYAARHNIIMIHFSTDYVFDGLKAEPYVEDDAVNPQSVYGKTKFLGEDAVRKLVAKHIIIRTSWVFGSQGENFLKTMLKLAKERDKLTVVSDQIGSPTSASMLAEAVAQIIKELNELGAYRKFGTYHIVGSGEVSWYDYAKKIVETAKKLGVSTKLTAQAIKPITSKEYPLPAVRPLNSRLDTTKVRTSFSVRLPKWEKEMEHVIHELMQMESAKTA